MPLLDGVIPWEIRASSHSRLVDQLTRTAIFRYEPLIQAPMEPAVAETAAEAAATSIYTHALSHTEHNGGCDNISACEKSHAMVGCI